MKVYLTMTKQTIPDGDMNAEAFRTYAEAVDWLEEVSGKHQEEWEDDNYVVFEDADYWECVGQIIEQEM